ncbi:MAG: VWA domain-containing protein [Myxococcales bacterium]|nr:VWA domain-containing protein [Myxococcales bacterium]
MTSRFPSLAITVGALAATLAAPNSAHAQCGQVPEVVVVLDRSESMTETISGQTKWALASAAVNQLAGQFAGQLKFGLMMFPRYPDATACTEGQLNVAPALNTATAIAGQLAAAVPFGRTPVTASLDVVRQLTPSGGPTRSVILITDGVETCRVPDQSVASGTCVPVLQDGRKCNGCGVQFCNLLGFTWTSCQGDPTIFTCPRGETCNADGTCSGGGSGSVGPTQAAAALLAAGVRTTVVGFGSAVDPTALNALAAAGGTGTYYQAGNLTQLTAALAQIAAGISCCGNGQLDPGEQCDTAIASGQGACPAGCNDNDPCTKDTLSGTACMATCSNTPITAPQNGDGCCPPGATPSSDTDCVDPCGNGVLDAGELCDPGIAIGQPGACPLNCDDQDPCTVDKQQGVACQAQCTHTALAADPSKKDGCCPPKTVQADDADCLPPCTPDRTTNCVDLCDGVTCPSGQICVAGNCQPADNKDAGPDGTTSPSSDGGANADASATPDAAGSADTWPGTSFNAADGGCNCRTSSGSDPAGAAPLLLLLALALIARRRRRDRR